MRIYVISLILYFLRTVTHFWVMAHQLRNAYLWRFSTAWYGTVRHGSVRYGTAQFGSVAFHRSLVPL